MASRPRLLIADPDPGIRRLLRRHFGNSGYTVSTVDLGRTALDQIRQTAPDVLILSTEMPDIAGIDFVNRVRAAVGTPLLVLTAAKEPVALDAILDAGADDCLTQPFLLEELAARIRRLLRRAGVSLEPRVLMTDLGELEISPLDRSVSVGGKPLTLTRKEFDFLALLAMADGATVGHDAIMHEIWAGVDNSARQNLRRVVGNLRRKIEADPKRPAHLISVHGSGYRLAAKPQSANDI
jgi:two-component system KDP operon response regulator KdpE